MKKWMTIVAALALVVGLAACGDNSEDTDGKEKDTNNDEAPATEEIEITDEEVMDDDQTVVHINGTEIKGDKYNNIYPQVKAQATQTEEEKLDQAQLKDRTIDSLVERELIMQGAKEAGVVVEDEEVQSEYDSIKSANEEGLTTLLEQFHLTEEGFIDQLKFELTLEKYGQEISSDEVTDEEIQSYYDTLKEQNEELPKLEELKADIKAQIQQQKSLQAIQQEIESMKEKADIERKV